MIGYRFVPITVKEEYANQDSVRLNEPYKFNKAAFCYGATLFFLVSEEKNYSDNSVVKKPHKNLMSPRRALRDCDSYILGSILITNLYPPQETSTITLSPKTALTQGQLLIYSGLDKR